MRKLSKKIATIILIMVFMVSSGFGCKGLSAQQVAATQPVTLEYWTVYDDVDAIQAQIDQFKVSRPYLTVNLKQLRIDEFYPRLLEALAEDKGPDIISVRNVSMKAYQTKLAAMPATAGDTTVTIQKTTLGSNTIVNTASIALPTTVQVSREYVQAVANDVVMDGKVYGLPLSMDTMALYYNKDLLDRAGVPEAPKTWDDFQKAVKQITKYDKKTNKILQSGAALGTGSNIPGFEDLLYILFNQSNVAFTSKSGAAVFNTIPQGASGDVTPAMAVMNFYTDFANPTRDTYSWSEDMDNALDKFVNGSLAFFFGYSFQNPIIKSRNPQLNYEVLPMLQLNPENPVNSANYWVQAVTAKSKHQNEAWNLINYLTHSKADKDYLDQANRPSALRAYIGGQMDKVDLYPFASQVLIANSWYKGKDYDTTVAALSSMLHEWLQPNPTPERGDAEFRQNILNRAAAKVNQTL